MLEEYSLLGTDSDDEELEIEDRQPSKKQKTGVSGARGKREVTSSFIESDDDTVECSDHPVATAHRQPTTAVSAKLKTGVSGAKGKREVASILSESDDDAVDLSDQPVATAQKTVRTVSAKGNRIA